MRCTLDHMVIWVTDPLRSVEFFETVVGLAGVRVDEFRAGKIMFPSVRISDDTILDLMPRAFAPRLNAVSAAADPTTGNSAGHPVHHVCFAMSQDEFEALRGRLEVNGISPVGAMQNSFGARGLAPHTYYFRDLDGNVFEARYYTE
jgi:catechol 2,3-dioxygenase-like lactoylglutathione lyase family enzyme